MDVCIGVFEVVKFHTKRHRARRRRVGLTAQLDPEAKTETTELTTGAHCEIALRHGGDAMLEIGE